MAFNDIEMAILSQLSYKNVNEGDSLHKALCDNKSYLLKSLSPDGSNPAYETQISNLIDKVKNSDYTIVKSQKNTSSGFSAFAVKDPNNNVTVACRGTELGLKNKQSNLDVWEDVKLGLSRETAQQKDMTTFMNDLQKGNYNKYSFTGHSLGGNLAMYGAITLSDKSKLDECTTFNAPGFNSKFHSDHKSEIQEIEKNNCMTSYQNKYDGVSEALTVPGNKVILSSKAKDHDGVIGHGLNDLVIKGNKFKTAKKKSVTLLGTFLYFVSRLPDSMLILGPVNPSMMSFAAGDIKMSSVSASGIGYSGSQKIELTPAELKGQASQMLALSNEYEHLFDHVISDLNSVNSNWSPNLANNFAGKITSAQEKCKIIPDMLSTGSAIATMAANNFESTDSLLAKVIVSDTNIQNNGSVVGAVKNTVGKTVETI